MHRGGGLHKTKNLRPNGQCWRSLDVSDKEKASQQQAT
jgi:hypothetical protein